MKSKKWCLSNWDILSTTEQRLHFGSVKKPLMDGMISGDLLRTNFLRPCSAYFSPSAKLSSTPAALFSLIYLTSGLVVMLRTNCIPQIPTATPTAANRGKTCNTKRRLMEEEAMCEYADGGEDEEYKTSVKERNQQLWKKRARLLYL
nr:luminal-binding protein 8-like [Ipomoea batatas]